LFLGGFKITKPSTPKIGAIYRIDANIHSEFKKICRREDVSMTGKHEEWEALYVQLHREGNPQLMLQVFLPAKAKALVLCNWLDGSKEGMVHCRKKGLWIDAKQCYGCEKNRLRKK